MAGCSSFSDLERTLQSTYILVKPFTVKDEQGVGLGNLITISAESFLKFFQVFGVENYKSAETLAEDKASFTGFDLCPNDHAATQTHVFQRDQEVLALLPILQPTSDAITQTDSRETSCQSVQVAAEVQRSSVLCQTDPHKVPEQDVAAGVLIDAGCQAAAEQNPVACQTTTGGFEATRLPNRKRKLDEPDVLSKHVATQVEAPTKHCRGMQTMWHQESNDPRLVFPAQKQGEETLLISSSNTPVSNTSASTRSVKLVRTATLQPPKQERTISDEGSVAVHRRSRPAGRRYSDSHVCDEYRPRGDHRDSPTDNVEFQQKALTALPKECRLIELDVYLKVHPGDLRRSTAMRYTNAHLRVLFDLIYLAQGPSCAILELVQQRVRHLIILTQKFSDEPVTSKTIEWDQSIILSVRDSGGATSFQEAEQLHEKESNLEPLCKYLRGDRPGPAATSPSPSFTQQRFKKEASNSNRGSDYPAYEHKPERILRSSSRAASVQPRWTRRNVQQSIEATPSANTRRKAPLLDHRGKLRSLDSYKV